MQVVGRHQSAKCCFHLSIKRFGHFNFPSPCIPAKINPCSFAMKVNGFQQLSNVYNRCVTLVKIQTLLSSHFLMS